MNTLESFYDDLEDLLPYVGKNVVDEQSPEGVSRCEWWNSHTLEFVLTNSLGTKKVIWYKFEQMVNKTKSV